MRWVAEEAPLADVADVVAGAASAMGFDELESAARRVAADRDDAEALYQLGYECVEREVGYLAVTPLRRLLRLAPRDSGVLQELVVALEVEHRYDDAVRLLEQHPALRDDWINQYLLVLHSVMSGDLEKARGWLSTLPVSSDDMTATMRGRLECMLARSDAVPPGSLHRRDLRGWHFVLDDSVLASLSPFGFDAMSGRWAYRGDGYDDCLRGLHRLG